MKKFSKKGKLKNLLNLMLEIQVLCSSKIHQVNVVNLMRKMGLVHILGSIDKFIEMERYIFKVNGLKRTIKPIQMKTYFSLLLMKYVRKEILYSNWMSADHQPLMLRVYLKDD